MTDDTTGEQRSQLIASAEAFADAPCDLFKLMRLHSTAYKIYKQAQAEHDVQEQALDTAVEAMSEMQNGSPWRAVENPSTFDAEFQEIKIAFDRFLSDDEIKRVSMTLEYAMERMIMAGKMSTVKVVLACNEGTVLQYKYDSAKSKLLAPDPDAAFLLAHRYIEEGTPTRSNPRADRSVRGTRRVEGIGGEQIARFYVR